MGGGGEKTVNLYGSEEFNPLAVEMEGILRDLAQRDKKLLMDLKITEGEDSLGYSEDELEKLRSLGYF